MNEADRDFVLPCTHAERAYTRSMHKKVYVASAQLPICANSRDRTTWSYAPVVVDMLPPRLCGQPAERTILWISSCTAHFEEKIHLWALKNVSRN